MVGAGFVAPMHLRGWAMVDNARVTGFTSRTLEKAKNLRSEFDIGKIYNRFEDMIIEERPTIVDICSPAETHLPFIKLCAQQGIHVICQKPIANDLETAKTISALARQHSIRLMVHENFRFRVWYREVKRQLDSGIIGKPFYCRNDARIAGTVRTSDFPDVPWSLARQPFFAEIPRFLILESAIHQIDVCRYLFGDIKQIYAKARKISPDVQGEDLTSMILDFDDLHAVVERSYASRGYRKPPLVTESMVIEGDRGSLFLEADGKIRIEVDVPGKRETITPEIDLENAYPNSYAHTILHFAECLRTGVPFETDIEDNLKTLSATLAAYKSVESRQSINLTGE